MLFVRAAAVSALALLAILQTAGDASADRLRLKVLWPRIYAPHLSGHLYRDEFDEEDDEGFVDWEDEDEYIPQRRRGRNIVLDLDEDDFEPVYEPPRKAKPLKAKPKSKAATLKAPAKKPAQKSAVVVKPKTKPDVKTASIAPVQAAVVPSGKALSAPVIAKAPVSSSALKAEPPAASAAIKPVMPLATTSKVEAPKALTPKPLSPKAQVASAAPAAGAIGCSKGAEIVSGYGFTSVKPRSCTGSTYSFNASRATNAYLIKVAAATGEITDVQKLK